MAAKTDAETTEAPVQIAAEEPAPKDWSPNVPDENGVHMTGDYPTNHRLRAEALVKARRKTDPDGIIADDLIEDTAARLKAEREDGGNS